MRASPIERIPNRYRAAQPGIARLPNWLRLLPLALIVALVGALPLRAEKPQDLKPQGYVNDFAGALPAGARTQLTALCTEVDQKAHAQIAIVTIHTLDGDSIEDFSIHLAESWRVGPKTDRGVLILYAIDDHRSRVEVGYGLEPILPDGKVGGFQRDVVPALRSGDYGSALLQLTGDISSVIAQASGVTLSGMPARSHRAARRETPPSVVVLTILIFIVFAVLRFFRSFGSFGGRGRGGWWWLGGGPWIGGGFGGGGFGGFGGGGGGGGGGFGGFGGGSFGGGGASGSW